MTKTLHKIINYLFIPQNSYKHLVYFVGWITSCCEYLQMISQGNASVNINSFLTSAYEYDFYSIL